MTGFSPLNVTMRPAKGGPTIADTPRRAETKLNARERQERGSMLRRTGLVQPITIPVRRVKEPKERRKVQ